MSTKKDELNFEEIIEKFYYFLRSKLHFDDLQASTLIMSIILLPITAYIGFTTSSATMFLNIFFITIGLDALVIFYSIIKFKYFKGFYKPLNPTDNIKTIKISAMEQIDQLKGFEFEKFVEQYYKSKGYQTHITQATHDGGADIIATKGNECIAIEVKRWNKKVTRGPILILDYAKDEYSATNAVLFTSSELTESAKNAARSKGVKYFDRYAIQKILRENPNIQITVKRDS